MIQSWTKNALERRGYLGQEATDTVVGLCSKIVIEAAESMDSPAICSSASFSVRST